MWRYFGLNLFMALAGLNIGGAHARAQTPAYDVVKGFSTGVNPNGVWTYVTVSGGHERPLGIATDTLEGISGWEAWIDHRHPPHTTTIAGNETGKLIRYGSIVAPTNELMLNPQDNAAVSIYFTAPMRGLYRIDSVFQAIDKRAVPHSVQVFFKGQTWLLASLNAYGQVAEYHHYITFSAGDVAIFAVSSGVGKPPPKLSATGFSLKIKGPIVKAN